MTSFLKKTFNYQLSIISYQLLKTENWKLKTTTRPGYTLIEMLTARRRSRREVALPGYTLIEMLISVTIFSGLLIIVLGTVATSSSSSAKVGILREKSQAARALIDQISSDLRYVDLTVQFEDEERNYQGFSIDSSRTRLILALLLPHEDKDFGLIRKEYRIERFQGHRTLTLKEGRGCKRAESLEFDECDQKSSKTDLLSTAYSLNQEQLPGAFPSEFSGLTVGAAENAGVSSYVSIDLTIKPSDLNLNCSADQVNPGTCYKVSTKVNMGTR